MGTDGLSGYDDEQASITAGIPESPFMFDQRERRLYPFCCLRFTTFFKTN